MRTIEQINEGLQRCKAFEAKHGVKSVVLEPLLAKKKELEMDEICNQIRDIQKIKARIKKHMAKHNIKK